MKKGQERGTDNRPVNFQLTINPETGEIPYFLDGSDTHSMSFKDFLIQNSSLIPILEKSRYFRNNKDIKEVKTLISLSKGPLTIDNNQALITVMSNTDKTYSKLVSQLIIKNIEKIPSGAFANFSNLITVEFGEGLKIIGDEAFKNTAITKLVFPETLEHIGVEAFANCKLHGSIKIPDAVKEIGLRAFVGNSGYRLKVSVERTQKLKIDKQDKD